MTAAILYKLLAIFLTVALGYLAGRMGWLGRAGDTDAASAHSDVSRVLGNVVFCLFVPALLLRTTARLDLAHMPWRTVAAFFVPLMVTLLGVYVWQRSTQQAAAVPAVPASRAITAVFGNSVQLGIPFATALFGEAGLAIHVALVSLHALVVLSVVTALAELDLARANATASLWPTLRLTARNTIVHPVVLPVLAGLAWNLSGLGMHPIADEALATLASAVVPLCLVLIGVTLADHGLRGLHGHLPMAVRLSLVKLLWMPALVLVVAHWGFGLDGLPLATVVMLGALPVGSNALIFAQRYGPPQGGLAGEATATIVLSTLGFALSISAWLALLRWLSPW